MCTRAVVEIVWCIHELPIAYFCHEQDWIFFYCNHKSVHALNLVKRAPSLKYDSIYNIDTHEVMSVITQSKIVLSKRGDMYSILAIYSHMLLRNLTEAHYVPNMP